MIVERKIKQQKYKVDINIKIWNILLLIGLPLLILIPFIKNQIFTIIILSLIVPSIMVEGFYALKVVYQDAKMCGASLIKVVTYLKLTIQKVKISEIQLTIKDIIISTLLLAQSFLMIHDLIFNCITIKTFILLFACIVADFLIYFIEFIYSNLFITIAQLLILCNSMLGIKMYIQYANKINKLLKENKQKTDRM